MRGEIGNGGLHGVLQEESLGEGIQVWIWTSSDHFWTLKTLSSSEERAIVKHILCHWIKRPEVSFSWVAWFPGNFDKTVIEREVVANGVLPCRKPLPVVREPGADELTDAMEGEPLAW